MFCISCGQQLPQGSAFCNRCDARTATPDRTDLAGSVAPVRSAAGEAGWLDNAIRAFIRAGPKAWVSGAILILAIIVGVIYLDENAPTLHHRKSPFGGSEGSRKQSAAATAPPVPTSKPVDLKAQILNDARKTARENYISTVSEAFRDGGTDASISDIDGELVIVSDLLKLKPNRDEVLRRQFGPAVRRDLCKIGFKTLALKGGVLFGDGDEYSLGCPETKEQKEARLSEQRTARQKYADDLQRTFNSDPQGHGVQMAEGNNELLLTAEFVRGVSPQMIRTIWASKFSDQEKKNLCTIGFRGLRLRADVNSPGTFMSFGCGNSAANK
jgi:hypothetical protein